MALAGSSGAAANAAAAGGGVVIACSALSVSTAIILQKRDFFHSSACARHVVADRLAAPGAFFDASLLDSQMDILEIM